ncbi:hypothetical protein SAMN05421779_11122 [Insolitispirillum peregrinum]|uniref:Uncharacterized protein n=1 Tax=Insolitispirillum peregrinum TaxID=80876 RepID=A0A1N7Q6H2_9PROT|nr:hypothetical protein SAMN05421779_11122 [Insolitispirillum peregrinum]
MATLKTELRALCEKWEPVFAAPMQQNKNLNQRACVRLNARWSKPILGERLVLGAIAVLAVGILLVATPRLIAGGLLALAPGVHSSLAYPSAEERPKTRVWLDAAADIAPLPDIAFYQTLIARLDHDADEAQALERLLKVSPLRPDEWNRLARLRLSSNPQQALQAWKVSVFSGRVYPPIMADRLEVGLQLSALMSADEQSILRDQIRLAYVLRPAHVQQMLARSANKGFAPLVTEVIAGLSEADIAAMVRIHALH